MDIDIDVVGNGEKYNLTFQRLVNTDSEPALLPMNIT